jgi:hypothetical protein
MAKKMYCTVRRKRCGRLRLTKPDSRRIGDEPVAVGFFCSNRRGFMFSRMGAFTNGWFLLRLNIGQILKRGFDSNQTIQQMPVAASVTTKNPVRA